VGDLDIIIVSLRRMINYHDSWAHRLPAEMLIAIVQHLNDKTSLITATHVCHLWRMTLLSSPRLWSHLHFANEECGLAFLGRSKSGPLHVDITRAWGPSEIVRGSLNEITTRVTTLWARYGDFLDELLAQSMPKLEVLEITNSHGSPPEKLIHLPSLRSLVVPPFDHLQFHVPLLTSLHLPRNPNIAWERTTMSVLDFLWNCPLLEFAFISCSTLDLHPDYNIVSLPLLRSFTHRSPCDEYELSLLNRLSLPSTCRVVLEAEVASFSDPWVLDLPTPRDSSYLSDIRTVKIVVCSCNPDTDEPHATFKTEFVNSAHREISFSSVSYGRKSPSHFSKNRGFLDILESIEIGSVETLCFDDYPVHTKRMTPQLTPGYITQGLYKFRNLKTLILAESIITSLLGDISLSPTVDVLVVYSSHPPCRPRTADTNPLYQVQRFAVSRKQAGTPLKALTLVFPFVELYPLELEGLMRFIERVEFLNHDDALCWDVDKYLLAVSPPTRTMSVDSKSSRTRA